VSAGRATRSAGAKSPRTPLKKAAVGSLPPPARARGGGPPSSSRRFAATIYVVAAATTSSCAWAGPTWGEPKASRRSGSHSRTGSPKLTRQSPLAQRAVLEPTGTLGSARQGIRAGGSDETLRHPVVDVDEALEAPYCVLGDVEEGTSVELHVGEVLEEDVD